MELRLTNLSHLELSFVSTTLLSLSIILVGMHMHVSHIYDFVSEVWISRTTSMVSFSAKTSLGSIKLRCTLSYFNQRGLVKIDIML